MNRVAVVTLVHHRQEHLDHQHASLANGRRRPDTYVSVAMDDRGVLASSRWGLRRWVVPVDGDPRGLPLARARNAGAAHALERGADVLVFLDVDCLAGQDLVAAYELAVTREPETVWSGPVTYLPPPPCEGYPLDGLDQWDAPHPARPDPGRGGVLPNREPDLFWSLSFAMSRTAWEEAGGFCEDYVGYGGEDTDFARTVVERGLTHAWIGDARAYHQWHEVSDPPVEHLDDLLRNGALFARRWGSWPMRGWFEELERLGLVVRVDDGFSRAPGPG